MKSLAEFFSSIETPGSTLHQPDDSYFLMKYDAGEYVGNYVIFAGPFRTFIEAEKYFTKNLYTKAMPKGKYEIALLRNDQLFAQSNRNRIDGKLTNNQELVNRAKKLAQKL